MANYKLKYSGEKIDEILTKADGMVEVGTATGETAGKVNLSDSINETSDASSGIAATPKAVKTAYDAATEGNTELIDIRTGTDGKVYQTAGDAVRGQIGELKSDLVEIATKETSENKFDKSKVIDGKYIGYGADYKIAYIDNSVFSCALVPVENGKTYTSTVLSYTALGFDKNLKHVENVYTITGGSEEKVSFTINNPSIAYVSICFRHAYWSKDTFMVVEGTSYPQIYIPFYEKLVLGDKVEPNENIKNIVKEKEYYVGATREHKSLMGLLTELRNDDTPKTIYVDSGEYDIYAEIGGDAFVNSIPSSALYWDYIVVVPPNTSIIGAGGVVLKYLPTIEVPSKPLTEISPLNISDGNVHIENIKIVCTKCRYAIHDQTKFDGNWKHTYKNVTLIKDNASEINGNNQAFGCGFHDGMKFELDSCVFKSHHTPISFHNGSNASIIIKNCVFEDMNHYWKEYPSLSFRNVNGNQCYVPVRISGTYLFNGIDTRNETETERPNAYEVIVNGCSGVTTVTNKCATNIYDAEVYG